MAIIVGSKNIKGLGFLLYGIQKSWIKTKDENPIENECVVLNLKYDTKHVNSGHYITAFYRDNKFIDSLDWETEYRVDDYSRFNI
jgi:hypothetical protein